MAQAVTFLWHMLKERKSFLANCDKVAGVMGLEARVLAESENFSKQQWGL